MDIFALQNYYSVAKCQLSSIKKGPAEPTLPSLFYYLSVYGKEGGVMRWPSEKKIIWKVCKKKINLLEKVMTELKVKL